MPSKTQKQAFLTKIVILVISTVFFITGFVLNITSNQALFNANLNIVPGWQNNQIMGSHGFLAVMNVVSNIFNPVICAGYIMLFYIFSSRKFQILVFLVWFTFLSFVLSILKQAIHQPRPYWIPNGSVRMLQWVCYTEYGCPSGHSMMGIILLQFIVRFVARTQKCVSEYIGFYYILIFALELLVMFSRVILGMHSLSQVLFGLMIGLYAIVIYYLFIENMLIRWFLHIFWNPKNNTTFIAIILLAISSISLSLLLFFLPVYQDSVYLQIIQGTYGCTNTKQFLSFHYRCFEDMAIIMVAVGVLLAFNFLDRPSFLSLPLRYSRISCKFLAKFLIMLLALIPIGIFFNPLWNKIEADTEYMALIFWACHCVGLFSALFFLILLAPKFSECASLELYKFPQSFQQFTKKYSNVKQYKSEFKEVRKITQLSEYAPGNTSGSDIQ